MKNILKNKKTLIVFALLVIVSTIGIYFAVLKKDPRFTSNIVNTPVPIPTKDFEKPELIEFSKVSKVPLKSSREEIIKQLGSPIDIEQKEDISIMKYETEYTDFPNELLLENGTLSAVKEVITQSDSRFNNQTNEYLEGIQNSSPVTRIDEDYGDAFLVNIYPDLGFALLSHTNEGVVFEVWNFVPSTMQVIDETWGKDLLTQEEFEQKELEEGQY